MFARHVRPLSADQLTLLTTQRLHAYRRKLLAVQQSVDKSDFTAADLARLDPRLIYFKDDPRWREVHQLVMTMLRNKRGGEGHGPYPDWARAE